MKRLIFATIIAGVIVCSCTKEDYRSTANESITLNFRLPGYEQTRAAEPGVADLNENLINSCFYFLFKEDGTGYPAVKGSVAGLSRQGECSETVPVSASTIDNVLFKDSRKCRVFVVVNPTAELEKILRAEHTLSELRNATLLSSLNGKQDNFVMVCDDELTVSSRTENELTANIDLKRLACKFTFHAKVASSVVDATDGTTWEPVTTAEGLNVTLTNLLNKTTLGGFKKSAMSASDYFESSPVPFEYAGETSGFQCFDSDEDSPIYSYPMEWEFTDRYEPCLVFEQVWHQQGTSNYVPRYYKLVLGQKSITSNEWYDITVNLDVLGSFERKDPTELFENMDYLVKGWNNAFQGSTPNTPADIKDMRYLMTYSNEYLMDNINTLSIPFTSSHPCIVEVESATYDDLTGEIIVRNGSTLSDTKYSAVINSTNDGIILTHNLENTMNSTTLSDGSLDYEQYTFKIKLYQDGKETAGESEYCKLITVRQNPALVVDAVLNDRDIYPDLTGLPANDGTFPKTREGLYTVYVNGNQKYLGVDAWIDYYGYPYHYIAGNASYMQVYGRCNDSPSPNLYTISVSKSDDYIIGDPRSTTPWTSAQLDFPVNPDPVSAPHFDGQTGGNRTLKYYYPTYKDADHENMIAPKYMIASGNSYCYGYILSEQEAIQRCATYQEYGYPAGRWRVPTLAEVKFIATLMAYGKMPSCFANGYDYWTASGAYSYSESSKSFSPNPSATTAYIRCVYDEWYWENSAYSKLDATTTPTYTTFVWGDMEREEFK